MYKIRHVFFGMLASLSLMTTSVALAQHSGSVFLEDLTSAEVGAMIRNGTTTVIIPTGGTEQNGAHMVLGKHNYIVKNCAEQIALKLGNAIVAPVLAYAPEGSIHPATGHMRFPGTISLPEEYFVKVVEYAARSLKVSGFKNIALIGDSGPNQAALQLVASLLNKEWRDTGIRVHFVSAYYDDQAFIAWLKAQGETASAIGTHAGISDTSQLLAVHPKGIRSDKLSAGGNFDVTGVSGDPRRAKPAYGTKGLNLKIDQAVAQIRQMVSDGKP
jgi:creatinine amidohydrolase